MTMNAKITVITCCLLGSLIGRVSATVKCYDCSYTGIGDDNNNCKTENLGASTSTKSNCDECTKNTIGGAVTRGCSFGICGSINNCCKDKDLCNGAVSQQVSAVAVIAAALSALLLTLKMF